jgi:hypothetical protein
MSYTQKLLLVLSGALLLGAEIVKRRPMGEKSSIIVGLIEVLIAIGIGVAFGLAKKKDDARSE